MISRVRPGRDLISFGALFIFKAALLLANPQLEETTGQKEDTPQRAEIIRQEKLEQKRNVEKTEENSIEDIVEDTVEWVVTKLRLTDGLEREEQGILSDRRGRQGVYPLTGSLASGSGFSLGSGYLSPALPGTPLAFKSSAEYSVKGYELYEFQFGKLPISKSIHLIEPLGSRLTSQFEGESRTPGSYYYANVRYSHFPQEDFFGFGPDSSPDTETDFLLRTTIFDGVAGYQFTPWLSTSFRAGYAQFDIGSGRDNRIPNIDQVFDERSLPGFAGRTDFLRVDSSIFFDYRDNPQDPHEGGMVGLLFARFNDRGSSSFEFNRYLMEARHYLPLWSPERTLALRFLTQIDDPDKESRIPFYLQGTLGGSDTLRGYQSFRFRDQNLLHLTAEYRWETTPGLGLVLFYDTGAVFSDRDDLDLSDLKNTFGTGVRLKFYRSMTVRFDVGFSPEGTRFIFGLGPTF